MRELFQIIAFQIRSALSHQFLGVDHRLVLPGFLLDIGDAFPDGVQQYIVFFIFENISPGMVPHGLIGIIKVIMTT